MTTCGDRRCAIPAHQRGAYTRHAFKVEQPHPLVAEDLRELVLMIPAAVVVVAGLAAFCWLLMAVMA